MNLYTKKVLARELLIFIVPVVLLIMVGGLMGLYFKYQYDKLEIREGELIQESNINMRSKIDSVKIADSLELIALESWLRRKKETDERIRAVKDLVKERANESNEFLLNIYGDTVHVDAPLRLKEKRLHLDQEKLRDSIGNIFGDRIYDGLLGIVYGVFLVFAYPIRLTIYAIGWALKTIRTK